MESLVELANDMEADRIDTLIIIGGNPVYTSPADLDFSRRLARAPLRVHQSLYYDETSTLCHWHIPESHYLESWGDAARIRRHNLDCATTDRPAVSESFAIRTPFRIARRSIAFPTMRSYGSVGRNEHTGSDFDTFWRIACVKESFRTPRPPSPSRTGDDSAPVSHRDRGSDVPRSKSSFVPIPPFPMADGPTTRGFRNCQNRSPNSSGTTPHS